MKKTISKVSVVLLAIALLVSQALPVMAQGSAAANDGWCTVCEGDGVANTTAVVNILPATCQHEGYTVYKCANTDCTGFVTLKTADKTAHVSDNVLVEAEPSTCTEAGTVAYETCVYCSAKLDPTTHDELTTIVDDADGHAYSDVVTPPSCTEGGYTTHTCSNCGDSYTDTETSAHGHDFSVAVTAVPATCMTDGVKAHFTCAGCTAVSLDGTAATDAANLVDPKKDHDLEIKAEQEISCTQIGYKTYGCDEPTCIYYYDGTADHPGITVYENGGEPLGHDIVTHEAIDATCSAGGTGEWEECSRCDYKTTPTTSNPLEHVPATAVTKEPTCTEKGYHYAITCKLCGEILNPGTEIPALGHTFSADVAAQDPTACGEAGKGNIAYKECTVCELKFATNAATDSTDSLTDEEVYIVNEHDWDSPVVYAPTCTEPGLNLYPCKHVYSGVRCTATNPEVVNALGHDPVQHAAQAPTCTAIGWDAYETCNRDDCQYTTYVEKAALGHDKIPTAALNPTYDASGNTAGVICSRCDVEFDATEGGATYLDELQEGIRFHYEITGVNGAGTAVNSGYVQLKIYFDVLKDEVWDKDVYNSDVLANIFGINFEMQYNADSFELTHFLAGNDGDTTTFAAASYKALVSGSTGTVKIAQDMDTASAGKVFRGENNLFATLTFQVNKNAVITADDDQLIETFTGVAAVTHPEGETVTVEYAEAATIEVDLLGDANSDGVFDANDILTISKWLKTAGEGDYETVYDLDRNGVVDGADLALLRGAAVEIFDYLDDVVDPNASVTPEV